ncbi:hypothetical protein PFICI_00941 [Pestalotiopsis fici W106-1]|uniref:Uncharacterized protein n=1 Tax=Pestalotiopsis fici (strain W106-1 / CGMCC3.15140) TaxID=1229662 RepID=W3XM31_PESFW|nr:uncharacterized protein PFICI_00941 [Pestalotiopsis fici W106-1]ETS87113.1 hypothetical protein PFICI_00941 [Pestalotiopsis fici W106-1]
MPYHEVVSDGFAYRYGRFYALVPNRVERVQGSHLRQMFLPKLTPEANKRLRDSHEDTFVRGQLKHYGVHFEEGEISGNGTLLIKKVLQAGKCDRVPDHITQLQERMHAEWLDKLTAEELSSYPDWIMERFFLSRGQADPTKTTTVVGIPVAPSSTYRAGQIREAADKIPGLHQVTGSGPKTQTIFLGWDRAAVAKAASGHAATEAKKVREADEEWEVERAEMHTDYLNSLKKKKKGSDPHSPIGSYMVDCQEIERE